VTVEEKDAALLGKDIAIAEKMRALDTSQVATT
jgi:hypothetical protein